MGFSLCARQKSYFLKQYPVSLASSPYFNADTLASNNRMERSSECLPCLLILSNQLTKKKLCREGKSFGNDWNKLSAFSATSAE